VREIANPDLTPADIPPPDADWGTVVKFALSYNGFQRWGSFGKCAKIANSKRHGSLDELRTCLFFEQRRWNHFGHIPDEKAMAYIRGVVEKIRAAVLARGTA
jgi:hypothetical protein